MTTSEIIRVILIVGLTVFMIVWRSGLREQLKERKEKQRKDEQERQETERRKAVRKKAEHDRQARATRTSQILKIELGELAQKSTSVAGAQLWYLQGGEASQGPTVLLLHGFASQKEDWNTFAQPLLQAGCHVIAPDLPGFGQNEKVPDVNYDVTTQAKRIRAFTKALELQSFHVVGSSLGGSVATAYTYGAAEQVVSLALIEPFGVRVPYESELDTYLKRKINPMTIGAPEAYDHLLAFLYETPPEIPAAVRKLRAQDAAEHRSFYLKMWPQIRGGERAYLLDLLLPEINKLGKPTLVLQGEKSKVVHPATAQMIATVVEGAETVVMPDCGHFPAVEKPYDAAGHYLRFLQRATGSA